MENSTRYRITEILHDGVLYIVYRGIRLSDQQCVILKTLKAPDLEGSSTDQLRFEQSIYERLNKENPSAVLPCYGLEVIDHHLSLVLEDKAIFVFSSQESAERKEVNVKDRDEGIALAIAEKRSLTDTSLQPAGLSDEIMEVAENNGGVSFDNARIPGASNLPLFLEIAIKVAELKEEERIQLAQLNMQAAHKAKATAAYAMAVNYLNVAQSLLPKDHWERYYDLSFDLYKNLASCLQRIAGQEKLLNELYEETIQHAKTVFEKVELYKDKTDFYIYSLKNQEAIDELSKALALFNIHFPIKPSKFSLLLQYLKFKLNSLFRGYTSIKKPSVSDAKIESIQLLAISMISPASLLSYRELQNSISLYMLNQTFSYGLTKFSSLAFITLAFLHASENIQKYQESYESGLRALEMAKQFALCRMALETQLFFYGFIYCIKNSMRSCIPYLRELFHQTLLYNSNLFLLCLPIAEEYSFIIGTPLDQLEQSLWHSLDEQTKYNTNTFGIQTMLNILEACRALKGRLSKDISEKKKQEYERYCEKARQESEGSPMLRFFCWVNFYPLYLYGQYEEILNLCEEFTPHRDNWSGLHWWRIYYFFQAMSIMALGATPEVRKRGWEPLKNTIQRAKKWAEVCPENYLHQYYLLAAEFDRVEGRHFNAIENYELAIFTAKEHGFTQMEALACELAGKYHLSQGNKKLAAFFLQDACLNYVKWVANAKASNLIDLYPELIYNLSNGGLREGQLTSLTSTSTTIRREFEVNMLIQSSQILAGEVILDRLISKLMQIVLTHAGANKVFLILTRSDHLEVVAEILPGQKQATLLSNLLLENKKNELCTAIVQYVAQSKKEILVDKSYQEGLFINNEYIRKHKPPSILCIPLVNQGHLSGLLYLENTISSGAFLVQHVRLLSMIATQMAISIENAYLYANLAKEMHEKSAKIKHMQDRLIQQEKIVSLGLLVAGVAHEIKNPLNFIINFAVLSSDLIVELKELLASYDKVVSEEDKLTLNDLLSTLDKNLTTVQQQGHRANRIIQTMQAHSRMSAEEKVPTNINQVIEEYLTLSSQSVHRQYPHLQFKLVKSLDPSLKNILTVSQDIGRVLLNLVNNSYYALNIKQAQQIPNYIPTLWVTTKSQEKGVEIKVRDNGIGIPSGLKDKVFTPFFTTKPPGEGTGLGLSLSRNIVHEHGGTMAFDTLEGEFTEFTVFLPG